MMRIYLLGAALLMALCAQAAQAAQLGSAAAFDSEGNLWLAGRDGASASLTLQKSSDDGKTWSAPAVISSDAVVASGDERPRIAFGARGQMYITYSRPLSKPYTSEVRFIRSEDNGRHFSAPVTVHQDRQQITHGFASTVVDADGRIFISWIDKRDLQYARERQQDYTGAAQYYAVSGDGGRSFEGDYKIADHTCECCRSALALDHHGRAVMMWRHVFAPNFRDHAIVTLSADGKPGAIQRASFDDWAIDACPHQGPAVAFAADGRRHQTWFTGGGLFYAAQQADGKLGAPLRLGGEQAAHADLAISGQQIEVVWKEFDGAATHIKGISSMDGGQSWQPRSIAVTAGGSDQPRLARKGERIFLVWKTERDAVRTFELPPQRSAAIQPFDADGMRRILERQSGRPFLLLVWSLDCAYCHASMKNLAADGAPAFDIVTIAIEPAADAKTAEAIAGATASLGPRAARWAFGELPAEQLRYQIDPKWRGELPRSYWYDSAGARIAVHSGLIGAQTIQEMTARLGGWAK